MPEPSSTPPVDPVSYTGCPGCTPYFEHRHSLRKSLRSDVAPAVIPDFVNSNDYYGGYSMSGEPRAIALPLPRHITDRVPIELYEHILDFLRWETGNLRSCALVCRAWRHHSQSLLYLCVRIESRAAYDAVAQACLRSGQSRQYAGGTKILWATGEYTEQRNYTWQAPLVLGASMPCLLCLRLAGIEPDYHPSFPLLFSAFSALIHLTLRHFRLKSFADLRSIICELKNLRELELTDGGLVSTAPTNLTAVFAPVNAPRLGKVTLQRLELDTFHLLAPWISSTEICCSCTVLSLLFEVREVNGLHAASVTDVLRKLGPSLACLDYNIRYIYEPAQHLATIAFCTCLVSVNLEANADWQTIVTTLHQILSHISSPIIRMIRLRIWMRDRALVVLPDDDIDLGLIHNAMQHPLFDSLRTAYLDIAPVDASRLTPRDVAFTKEEMEHRMRLILEPWDKRRILTIEGYNELTDEKIQRHPEGARSPSRKQDSGKVVVVEHSPEDEIVPSADQQNEDGVVVRSSEGS